MTEATKQASALEKIRIRLAQSHDVEPLARLINAAFRVELPFIEGDRTNPHGVRTYMEKGEFLLAENSAGLAGCVYVELRGKRGYLGLLGVDPSRQGTGLGRKLMDAAENYFREKGCVAVDLRVISPRAPLPSFYRHLGYVETGTAPFAPEIPLKGPGHYILMSKNLV
jgi:ribosomal protein S18 acetylase RimI-like enzyme